MIEGSCIQMEVDPAYMIGMLKVEDETYSCIQIEILNMETSQKSHKENTYFSSSQCWDLLLNVKA
jgi:hypothetical protein